MARDGHGKKEAQAEEEAADEEEEEEKEEEEKLYYCLKPLSAPMYDAKSVTVYEQLDLIPGKVYCFGRSKSTCDIIFQDARVSRQHCRLYVDPEDQVLYLVDGKGSENFQPNDRSGNPKVSKNLEHQSDTSPSSHRGDAFYEMESAGNFLHKSTLLKSAKSSMNGIYVNGCRLNETCKVLSPGDVVSLVALTKGTDSADPTFGAAIGFSVDERHQVARISTRKSLSSPTKEQEVETYSQLRITSSEGDKLIQSDFTVQAIGERRKAPAGSCDQATTCILAPNAYTLVEKNTSLESCTRHSSGHGGKEAADDLSQAPRSISTSLHYEGFSSRMQEVEKFRHPKIMPLEAIAINERGQKRHHSESFVEIENTGRGLLVNFETGTHCSDVYKEASRFPLQLLEGRKVDEEQGLLVTGERAVRSLLGRNTKFASNDQLSSDRDVDMDGGMATRELYRDTLRLPFGDERPVEPQFMVKEEITSGKVEECFRKACFATTQLISPPLSPAGRLVKSPSPKIGFPSMSSNVETRLDMKPSKSTPESSEHELKGCTLSMSQPLNGGSDQFCTVLPQNSNLFSLLAERQESATYVPQNKGAGATTKTYSIECSQNKHRARSSAEILKLMSKGMSKRDTDFPVANSAVVIVKEGVPQTLDANVRHSSDQQVGNSILEISSSLEGDPSQSHWKDEDGIRSEQERLDIMNEKSVDVNLLRSNLELEEKSWLRKTKFLSVDGPGIHGFCLNRLKRGGADSEGTDEGVSLQELLAPLDEVVEIFAATFTSNIPWFMSSSHLSPEIPVTIACHDYVRSWSASLEDRIASPYEEWPNLTIVYPPFPDVLAFSSKSKEGHRRGIGCHHPKLFLVRFNNRLRVVISSANLNRRQWLQCTNTVWWKDFPQLQVPKYRALFQSAISNDNDLVQTTGDFSAQLAYFIACLLIEVPAKAHWVVNLAQYDFSSAEASLVVSIPGLHGNPYPALSSAFLTDLQEGSKEFTEAGVITPSKFLGVVSTTVVGISYRFSGVADPKGLRVRGLAKLLNGFSADEDGMIVVFLKRAKNIAADTNAVSVVVGPSAGGTAGEAFLRDISRESSSPSSSQDCYIQLGFLSRNTANWVAPLCDGGLCTFLGRIWPKEALSIASGLSEGYVRLALYVFEGPQFSRFGTIPLTTDQATAISRLLCVLQYPLGLHRLEQVLSLYKWPNSKETDFVFGSSSVGTSLDAPFLAAFSAAAGRRAEASSASDDSDPQWGCWTADHEAEDPSIGVVFPTIERARASTEGPLSHLGVLYFAEKAWERLKPAKLLHDAVPYSASREGIPMHSKVAMRRFQHHLKDESFGWVYCGSHNFSPAAWGRPLPKAPVSVVPVLGIPILISNYELGLIFLEPPPLQSDSVSSKDEIKSGGIAHRTHKLKSKSNVEGCDEAKGKKEAVRREKGLDRFRLPFVMPPPKYKATDQPATRKALYRILLELRSQCKSAEESAELEESILGDADSESGESEPEEVETTMDAQEIGLMGGTAPAQMEQQYAEALWSQIEPY